MRLGLGVIQYLGFFLCIQCFLWLLLRHPMTPSEITTAATQLIAEIEKRQEAIMVIVALACFVGMVLVLFPRHDATIPGPGQPTARMRGSQSDHFFHPFGLLPESDRLSPNTTTRTALSSALACCGAAPPVRFSAVILSP